jgi:hypothetical protein
VDLTRRISVATGALLVVATVAAVAAAAVLPPLTGPDYLPRMASHDHQVAAAALLYLIAAGTSVGIAIALYPVLKRTHAALALGAVVFRTIEAAFYTAAVVSLISLSTLSRQLATTAPASRAPIHALAANALSVRDHSTLAGVLAFSVASCMYSVLFFQSRLVPRWLSVWGVVGALLMATAGLASLFSDAPVTGYYALFLPIAVWEMVLAAWLLLKGFNPVSGPK